MKENANIQKNESSKLSVVERKKLDSLESKSMKIRYLAYKNFSRSEIAKILNLRYQHVRNVLITPIKKEVKF